MYLPQLLRMLRTALQDQRSFLSTIVHYTAPGPRKQGHRDSYASQATMIRQVNII